MPWQSEGGHCHLPAPRGPVAGATAGRVAQQVVRAARVQKALEPEHVGRLLVVCLLARRVVQELLQPLGSLSMGNLQPGLRRSFVAWRGAWRSRVNAQKECCQQEGLPARRARGRGQDANTPALDNTRQLATYR